MDTKLSQDFLTGFMHQNYYYISGMKETSVDDLKLYYGSLVTKLIPFADIRECYEFFLEENPVDYLQNIENWEEWYAKLHKLFTEENEPVAEPVVETRIKHKEMDVQIKIGISGTPAAASFLRGLTPSQERALARLKKSAKYYKRPCSC